MEPGLRLLALDLPGEKNAVTQSALQGVLGPAHRHYFLNMLPNQNQVLGPATYFTLCSWSVARPFS